MKPEPGLESGKSGQFTLRGVRTFVAILEEQSISGAAKRLGSSISAISLQLTNLEKALGVRLVERSAQRFFVTEAGELFRARALRILDEVDGASADLAASRGAARFTLRMAVVEDFDNHVLPRWLAALSGDFPHAKFVVKSGPSHENFSILSGRGTDLIVAVDAMDPVDWIEEHPLLRDPYLLVRSKAISHLETPQDLLPHPFVRYAREQHMGRQIEAQLRRLRLTPERLHEFSSNQAVFAMVGQMKGWAISTASAVQGTLSGDDLERAGIMISKLPFAAFSRNVSLYARRDILSSVPELAAQRLREALVEACSGGQGLELPVRPEVLDA